MKLAYERRGEFGWLTMVNPPTNTLLDPRFAGADELEAFLAAPDLKGVILRGQGRHFCGGANLDALAVQARDPAALEARLRQGAQLLQLLAFAPVPVVAAIRGMCLGAGLELALACHFRCASDKALLGFPEAELGLLPGFGGTVFCQGALEPAAAVELMLSGRLVGGEEAHELGLLQRVCATRQLERRVLGLLDELVGKRSCAQVHAVMGAVHAGRRLPTEQALQHEIQAFCSLLAHDG